MGIQVKPPWDEEGHLDLHDINGHEYSLMNHLDETGTRLLVVVPAGGDIPLNRAQVEWLVGIMQQWLKEGNLE